MGLLKSFLGLAALVSTTQAVVPDVAGYKVTWSDDFTGGTNAPPSSSNWITDTGTSYPGGPAAWGTGEVQTYTSSISNVRQTGRGALQIIALKTTSLKGVTQWTSARIETQRKDFVAKAGGAMRIEARMALPSVSQPAGYWPAFWALGAAYRGNYTNWPSIGEIDIMESVNGVNKAYGSLHCDVIPGGQCNEPNGIGNTLACSGTACQGNYHTYTVEIDRTNTAAEAIRWYLDGTLYYQVTQSQFTAAVWNSVARSPVFILLNMAMGGSFPTGVYGSSTPLSTTTSGGIFTVDYVAVYNK